MKHPPTRNLTALAIALLLPLAVVGCDSNIPEARNNEADLVAEAGSEAALFGSQLTELDAYINGPSTLFVGESGTWEANVSGGSGATSYLWRYRVCDHDGSDCGSWRTDGDNNNSTYSGVETFGAGGRTITLWLRVTRGSESVTDTFGVVIKKLTGGGGDDPPCKPGQVCP